MLRFSASRGRSAVSFICTPLVGGSNSNLDFATQHNRHAVARRADHESFRWPQNHEFGREWTPNTFSVRRLANGRQSRAFPKTLGPSPAVRSASERVVRVGVHVGSWKVHVTPIPSGSCRRSARETSTVRKGFAK